MQSEKRKTLAFFASALTAALCPTIGRAQSDSKWQKLVNDAKQEGKVVLYTPAVGSPYHRQIGASFEKLFGIRFEALEARPSELRERVRAEQTAGRFLGDVLYNGSSASYLMAKDGHFQPHAELPNIRNLLPAFASDGVRVPVNVQSYGILANRNLVKPADEPKSWFDLLDPKWKGKILSDDMRALGIGSVLFAVTYDAFGRDFHERLAAQKPVFSRNLRNDQMRVARAEYPLYITQLLPYFVQLKGLPVAFVVPKEGRPYIRFDVSVLRNAPRPNAANLFMNYLLEMETQLLYANAGFTPITKGVLEQTNDDIKALMDSKLLGTTDPTRQDEMLALANTIYS